MDRLHTPSGGGAARRGEARGAWRGKAESLTLTLPMAAKAHGAPPPPPSPHIVSHCSLPCLPLLYMQYVHAIFTTLAYHLHEPLPEPLHDIGWVGAAAHAHALQRRPGQGARSAGASALCAPASMHPTSTHSGTPQRWHSVAANRDAVPEPWWEQRARPCERARPLACPPARPASPAPRFEIFPALGQNNEAVSEAFIYTGGHARRGACLVWPVRLAIHIEAHHALRLSAPRAGSQGSTADKMALRGPWVPGRQELTAPGGAVPGAVDGRLVGSPQALSRPCAAPAPPQALAALRPGSSALLCCAARPSTPLWCSSACWWSWSPARPCASSPSSAHRQAGGGAVRRALCRGRWAAVAVCALHCMYELKRGGAACRACLWAWRLGKSWRGEPCVAEGILQCCAGGSRSLVPQGLGIYPCWAVRTRAMCYRRPGSARPSPPCRRRLACRSRRPTTTAWRASPRPPCPGRTTGGRTS